MVNDFQKEIEGKLEEGEIIEKCFEGDNYKLVNDCENIAVGTGSFKSVSIYNCRYTFVLTNKRIFVGNVYPFSKIVSYNIYDKNDIEIIN